MYAPPRACLPAACIVCACVSQERLCETTAIQNLSAKSADQQLAAMKEAIVNMGQNINQFYKDVKYRCESALQSLHAFIRLWPPSTRGHFIHSKWLIYTLTSHLFQAVSRPPLWCSFEKAVPRKCKHPCFKALRCGQLPLSRLDPSRCGRSRLYRVHTHLLRLSIAAKEAKGL